MAAWWRDGKDNTSLLCHRRCCTQSVYMLGFDLRLLLTRTTLCGNFTSNGSSQLYIVADDNGETNNVSYTQVFKYIFLINSMKTYGMLWYFHTSRIPYHITSLLFSLHIFNFSFSFSSLSDLSDLSDQRQSQKNYVL